MRIGRTWIDNANYFRLIPVPTSHPRSPHSLKTAAPLCNERSEKRRGREREENTQAWKQFYSDGVSERGAPRNQELRFFLTTFLAYLCWGCAEIALPWQNIFQQRHSIFSLPRRKPFSFELVQSLPGFPSQNI